MTKDLIRGVLMHPGCEPMPVEIAAGLENLQAMVGGLIERYPFPDAAEDSEDDEAIDVWMNEEGRLAGLPECVRWDDARLGPCVLVGPLFVAASDDTGATVSLSPEQEREVLAWLAQSKAEPARYDGPEAP